MSGVQGLKCVVTGGSGLVGRRLVEMLVQRGAASVVSFDIAPIPVDPALEFLNAQEKARVKYVRGDLTKAEDVLMACEGADAVWHIGALVGPYYQHAAYYKVNYEGTLNVIAACRAHGIRRLVGSSSPSTRFDGRDIAGLREDQLSIRPAGEFLEAYAETKAMGEVALREACSAELLTVAVAPHQVYGPRDSLFLPNLLYAQGTGKLRVLGDGENDVSFCHVDNYCHGLIIAMDKLYPGSPVLGKFYIVTDGPKVNLWRALDKAGTELGFGSLFDKFKVPYLLLLSIAMLLNVISKITGYRFRLTPFTVKMLTIHRWFDISNAERDLGYKPIIKFEEGWKQTISWFSTHDQWWRSCAEATLNK
jgi:nucleoside-diphosphate-sugar epimerase